MTVNFCLSSAPSTDNPCLLLLREKNYRLRITCSKKLSRESLCIYIAEKEGRRFAANSGPELLGLVTLWENYGENWNRQEPDIMDEIIEEGDEDPDGMICTA